jgi:hypothetical protein
MTEVEFRRFVDTANRLEACRFISMTQPPSDPASCRPRPPSKRTHGLDLIVDYLLVRGTNTACRKLAKFPWASGHRQNYKSL